MYDILLIIHNLLRWVVLILGLAAVVRGLAGWLGKQNWQPLDRRLGSFYTMSLDIQFLVGLLLYFVFSDLTTANLGNFGQAMGVPDLRFFLFEHPFTMLVAVILAHLGTVLARRADSDTAKFRRLAIWTLLSLLAILVAIPWERPLFRL